MRRVLAPFVLSVALVSGCAAPGPSSKGVVAQQAQVSQQLVQELQQKDKLVEDRALNAYLRQIVGRIEAVRPKGYVPIRSYIIKDASVNAFTPGGGYVFVNAGMIAAMENEAQLAMVLSHEIAHIDRGHVEAGQQANSAIGAAGAIGAIAAGIAGVPGGLTQLLVGGAQMTASNAYSRSQESDADTTGFQYAAAAGYDVAEGAKSFAVLKRIYGDQSDVANFFMSSHPQSGEREAELTRMARAQGGGGRIAKQEYLERTSKLRKEVLRYLEANGRSAEAAQLRRNVAATR